MRATIFVLALAAAAASSAVAGPFTQLCDTGVSNCTTESPITTQDVADSHFSVTTAPAGVTSPSAVTYFTSGYFQSGANPLGTTTASWISTSGTGGITDTVGTYNYQEAIVATVTGPVTISGSWGVDNCGTLAWGSTPVALGSGTGITIGNGVGANCASVNSTFNTLTLFSFGETVTAGTTYYLDFEVGNTGGPTALMVDSLAAACAAGAVCGGDTGTSTPEPSSVLLTLTGIALLGLAIRRRLAGQRARS